MKDILLLEEKPTVDFYLKQTPRALSSFSFISVFAWCDFFDFELKTIKDLLCIFAHGQGGSFLYLPPLGKNFNPSVVEDAFAHMARDGRPKGVNRIENIPGNLLSAFSGDGYNQYAKPTEYVYHKEDLVALRGNAYKSQRHDCNCFTARHTAHAFRAFRDEDLVSCMDLYEHWAHGRAKANSDGIYRSMLKENRLVHGRLLKFWRSLGLTVRVLEAQGKIIGYSFGYALDESTFCIYAEVADLKITGAAAYMFRNFCADEELKKFTKINAMDDFAMPNVARAKQAYHPAELIDSYTVSIKA